MYIDPTTPSKAIQVHQDVDRNVSDAFRMASKILEATHLAIANVVNANADAFDADVLAILAAGTAPASLTTLSVDGYPTFRCLAWVNFNGTGTVAIRDSDNVSSITDNGTGQFGINFTNALPHANYAILASCGDTGPGAERFIFAPYGSAPTVNGFDVIVTDGATIADPVVCSIAVFG